MITKQRLLLLMFVIETSLGSEIDLCSTITPSYDFYDTKDTVNCNCRPPTCVRKCCRYGFEYADDLCVAVDTSDLTLLPEPLPFHFWDKHPLDLASPDGFRIGMLRCKPMLYMAVTENYRHFYLNGSLSIAGGILSPTEYCINRVSNSIYYFYCPYEFKDGNDEVTQEFSCIGELISIPFLLATFLVYAFLPNKNIQRNALMFHCLSVISHNILLALNQYYILSDYVTEYYNQCKIAGFLRLYFRSAAYFWVNVMCFDVWLAFRNLNVEKKSNKKIMHFVGINIIAWGMPCLFLLMVFLGEGISEKNCYLKVPEYLTFNVGSGIILLLFNLVLIVLTTRNIQKAKKEIAREAGSNGTHSGETADQFTLYWNLLFVVGYSTLFNVHLVHLAIISVSNNDTFTFLNYYNAFINGTYGVGIFIIYVCRRRMRRAIKDRYYQITGKLKKTEFSFSEDTITSNQYC